MLSYSAYKMSNFALNSEMFQNIKINVGCSKPCKLKDLLLTSSPGLRSDVPSEEVKQQTTGSLLGKYPQRSMSATLGMKRIFFHYYYSF